MLKSWIKKKFTNNLEPTNTLFCTTQGMQAFTISIDDLLLNNKDLLIEIENALALGLRFNQLIMPLIVNFASFIHLIPASKNDHHHELGGLFRHSLEVCLDTILLLDKSILAENLRHEAMPRWRTAGFLAGLCHDLGKCIDVTVTDSTGCIIWSPYLASLSSWASEHKLKFYYVTWRKGRRLEHIPMSMVFLDHILFAEIKDFIYGFDLKIGLSFINYFLNVDPKHKLSLAVTKADVKSAGCDNKVTQISQKLEPSMDVLALMQHLVIKQLWQVNVKDGAIWHFEFGTFLDWDIAVIQLIEMIDKYNVQVSKEPKLLVHILLNNNYIIPKTLPLTKFELDNFYWQVKLLDVDKGSILNLLRLKDSELICLKYQKNIQGEIVEKDSKQNNIFVLDDKFKIDTSKDLIISNKIDSEPQRVKKLTKKEQIRSIFEKLIAMIVVKEGIWLSSQVSSSKDGLSWQISADSLDRIVAFNTKVKRHELVSYLLQEGWRYGLFFDNGFIYLSKEQEDA